jgi:FecR protein
MKTNLLLFCLLTALNFSASAQNTSLPPGNNYTLAPDSPPVLESDVIRNEVDPSIILPLDYSRQGDLFTVKTTSAVTARDAWVMVTQDWIEPITPPDRTQAPAQAPAEMKLLEISGEVTVATSVAPAQPIAANEGMAFPDGGTIYVGTGGSAAIFIGGINSLRFGPDSSATIHYRAAGSLRETSINLDKGFVFSKVGTQPGIEQFFKVKTALGTVVAKGTDFFTLKLPTRMDVALVKGTIELGDSNGKIVASATATRDSGMQVVRTPEIKEQLPSMTADSETLGAIIHFIPDTNLKLNHLRDRQQAGVALADYEQSYIKRIPQISYLIRVHKVDHPADSAAPSAQ